MTKKQKLLLLAIIAFAVFFRFYLINQMPGGLFPDEAANGLDINLMQQGHLQPFYERGNGREALFFYMEWASVALFGKGIWQFHIVSALIGVLSVISVFFFTQLLFSFELDPDDLPGKNRATNIALLASFLMAVSTWYVVLSRTALRANLTPLFGTLTLYFLLRTYKAVTNKTRLWFAFLTGVIVAGGLYTYIAYRIMGPILFMLVLWPLLASYRQQTLKIYARKYLLPLILFLISFVIVVYPIANYFYHNFSYFIGRSGQVSIFNQSLYTVDGQQLHSKPPIGVVVSVLGEVTKTALEGFFIHGDLNWRQNISGYPMLSPLISPFFGVGLVLITFLGIWYFFAPNKRSKFWKFYLLTGWFWGMLIPEISTAEGIPHGLRSAGIIPPVFIITAWALYGFGALIYKFHKQIWERCWCHPATSDWEAAQKENQLTHPDHPHYSRYTFITFMLKVVVACFCLALVLQTYALYFIGAYNDPANFYSFRSDLAPVSQYLVNHCQDVLAATGKSSHDDTFLILDTYSVQSTDYLTSDPKGNFSEPCNVPYKQVDPEHSWQLPPLTAGQEAVFTQSTIFDTAKFTKYHPEVYLERETRNKFGQAVLAVFKAKQ